MFTMTHTEIDARIAAKESELQELQYNHAVLLRTHQQQILENETRGCKIQGAIDELKSLKSTLPPESEISNNTITIVDSPPA